MKTGGYSRYVYFVASLKGKEKYGHVWQQVATEIKKAGYDLWDDVNHVSPDLVQSMSEQQIKKYYNTVAYRIRACDIFVAEISYPSISVGYEIGQAIAQKKPVLLLRTESLSKITKLGAPLRGNPSNLLKISYYTKDTLAILISSFIRKAQRGILVKRIPIEFTQGQIEYIDHKIHSSKKSFNAAVREIIDEAALLDIHYRKTRFRSM